ncbi:MAG: maleylpyruvate isomerase N-terminal domain-containing protein [Chloroflexota bacterium]
MNIPLPPTITAPLFPRIYAAHVAMLRALTQEQWTLATACAGWSVKDVALHMLADDVGWLSGRRDNQRERATIATWDDLMQFINDRNDLWVHAMRRMSTKLLVDFVPMLGLQVVDFVNSLEPNAPGMVINWAGSDVKPLWFEIGRELTERWMHHQHICDAINISSLKEADMIHAVMEMFIRALPHTYSNIVVPDGSAITLWLIGIGGGSYTVVRLDERWQIFSHSDMQPACTVSLPVETAWRLFTKGITSDQARQEVIIEGDMKLAEPLLHMVSILA